MATRPPVDRIQIARGSFLRFSLDEKQTRDLRCVSYSEERKVRSLWDRMRVRETRQNLSTLRDNLPGILALTVKIERGKRWERSERC